MMIEIEGYVTQSHGKNGFKIKITKDDVKDKKGKHPQLLNVKKIEISPYYYPDDLSTQYVKSDVPSHIKNIKKCRAISEGLEKGDRIRCCVYIVEEIYDKHTPTYIINSNRNDILTYTIFRLWLYPNPDIFKRLHVDTPRSLKFRKQNYYMDKNINRCEAIAGGSVWRYKYKWWINKKPMLLFPVFLWIRIKKAFSNLWSYLSVKNLTILGIILSVSFAILGIVATFFVGVVFG